MVLVPHFKICVADKCAQQWDKNMPRKSVFTAGKLPRNLQATGAHDFTRPISTLAGRHHSMLHKWALSGIFQMQTGKPVEIDQTHPERFRPYWRISVVSRHNRLNMSVTCAERTIPIQQPNPTSLCSSPPDGEPWRWAASCKGAVQHTVR
jgi:hypothetical protein